jgi:small subunit ribosomal protein MRP21
MGPRHLSELLLRPAALARISAPRPSPIRCLRHPQPQPTRWALPSTQRHLNTTPTSHAAQPQPKEEEALDAPAEDNSELSSEIDTLFGLSKTIRRTTTGRTPNSGDEFEATRRLFGSEFSSPGRGTSLRPQAFNFDDLSLPDEPVEPAQAITIPEEDIKYPRLTPAYGRTVNLDESRGRDIVRGINMLGSLMARNKVKQDFNKQRYHERPGLKRKRLHSERWRARFKVGFNGVVGRVSELTRKGW